MPQTQRVGQLLADKYRLEALLGAGGMGYVFRAVNVQVGRPVAIKLLREEYAKNEEVVDRFLREARTANLVRHPNVVDVLDLGKDEGGVPFIVQELLDGEDLAKFVAARGGSLGLEEVETLLLPIIDAVAEAHARGVVHRDIKPDNVFVAKAGAKKVPKLLDFGISKVSTADVRATDVGVMMGTPAYMPPEQVKGARDADARSDVWALGVMLFEVLSGRLPFEHTEAPALFVAIVTEDAPLLADVAPSIAPSLARVVERCLRKKPDERYPSAAELARDLRHALQGVELEPTQRRSLPPSLSAMVPDLDIPRAPALPSTPRVESARASEPKVAAAPPPPPAPAAPRAAPPAVSPFSTRDVAALPGTMMGPAPPPRTAHGYAGGSRAMREPEPASSEPARRVVAISGVGVACLAGLAILMAVGHQAEGWPVARFLVSATGTLNVVSQGIMALAAFLVGGSRVKRAVQQWEGDVSGGIVGALLTSALAAVAFFCAVELARAAT